MTAETVPWYRPGELIEHATDDLHRGKTPERIVHEEVRAFIDAKEDPDEGGPEMELEEFLRFMLDEYERARHHFARLQIAAIYALAHAETTAPEFAS
jgi:hypothetical protein